MTKPDYVRCETCVFFGLRAEDTCTDVCHFNPNLTPASPDRFCQHWQEDWNGEVDMEWVTAAIKFCRGVGKDVLRYGRIGAFAREYMSSRERIMLPEIDAAIRVLEGKPE